MKKALFILAIGSVTLFSCHSSNDDNDEIVPITLTSKVVIEGRNSMQSVQIANGEEVSFFVTRTSSLTEIVHNNAILTADGNGNFTYSSGEQSVLYYPVEPVNVDFYAVHPYAETTALGSVMNFEVNRDQTTLENYYVSDLLYSQKKNIPKSRNTIPMLFNHKLTKISLIVKQGPGMDLSDLSSIQIMNVLSQINMNVSDGALVPISGTETEIDMYGVRGTVDSETQISGIAAIIVPQSFVTSGNKELFRLVINGVNYFYKPASGILYEEGKVYNYTLTVNNSGVIDVTSSITDWLPGDDITGEVE